MTLPADTWYRYWARRAARDAPGRLPAAPPTALFHVKHGNEPAPVVVVANQKGGVGKTTTAVSLSAALAERGARVLLVDLDPQANATSALGVSARGRTTIYEVLVLGAELESATTSTAFENLTLVPATLDLAGAEIELVSALTREQKLTRALQGVRGAVDVVVVDCPPSLGLLTLNALAAASHVVVPIQCEYFALEGLGAFQRNAELVRSHLNPGLALVGIVLTMFDGRTRLGHQVADEVTRHFGDVVFATRIPRSVRLAEAPSFGQPITSFDGGSRAAAAYRELADELAARLAGHGRPRLDVAQVSA